MISQLTVFLQNEKGRLSSLSRILSDEGINMHALIIADTQEFGIVRIFCDTPDAAQALLVEQGFRATLTDVSAVRIANEPGGLARLLEFLDAEGLNVEYGYCFLNGENEAIDVFKIDGEDVDTRLADAGFAVVEPHEVYALS